MPQGYSDKQLGGSEYSGVSPTINTLQPIPSAVLDNGEKLRLGYLTGEESNSESLEDRRQFYGLRPAGGKRPQWLGGTGQESQADVEDVGEREP